MEYMSWEEAGIIVGTEEWKEKQNNAKDPAAWEAEQGQNNT